MTVRHKNKTFATFLAATTGTAGVHRFYLHGAKDRLGWAHFLALPLALIVFLWRDLPLFAAIAPIYISMVIGLIEALAIGLTMDEKWDRIHNRNSGQQSASGWPLAVLIVLTFGIGAIALIAAIARTFDLLLTGGAYG